MNEQCEYELMFRKSECACECKLFCFVEGSGHVLLGSILREQSMDVCDVNVSSVYVCVSE